MSARSEILEALRSTLARPDLRFPGYNPRPLTDAERMVVTQASGDIDGLAERFGRELEALHGSYEIAASISLARMACVSKFLSWVQEEAASRKGKFLETEQEKSVLCWAEERLPIPGLVEALQDTGFRLVIPEELHTEESKQAIRYIRLGLTSVEAAFAATGSMLMTSSTPGSSRMAGLLPFRHLALIPYSTLYPTIESWLARQRRLGTLNRIHQQHANLFLVTGPSKSGDIEGHLTLGVHGPKVVHAILFDDL